MSDPAPKILMCSPEYFGVEYVINPWMQGHVGRADASRARKQWDVLHSILSALTDVQVLEGARGLPDMCFAANAGLVLEDVFVQSVFRVPQRAPEVPLFSQWMQQAGYRVISTEDDALFEGEGDALFHPGLARLWAGYGVRSSLESHPGLAKRLNVDVVSLRLVDQRFYHLDTCFFPLPNGRVVYYPAAFDEWSRRTIEQMIPQEDRLEVSESDATRFACNAVRIGQTLVTNGCSIAMQSALEKWGYEVLQSPMDEFMLAGGAAKCLCLMLNQDMPGRIGTRPEVRSPVADCRMELQGHLLDSGMMNRALDTITEAGGGFRIEHFGAGERHDQPSIVRLRVSSPSQSRLESLVAELMKSGAHQLDESGEARTSVVDVAGVAPDDFYSTTIYPTEVRLGNRWVQATGQRMDAMLVVNTQKPSTVRCELMRNLRAGDLVVCGSAGVRVRIPQTIKSAGDFAFMSAGVSSERRVETQVDQIAWEMKRIKSRGGRIVLVAGPVVVHTGGAPHLETLIRRGYVQALLTGNALPVHDIELNMYGTSLGVDLKRGVGVPHGHQHHLRAINRVRRAGSIAKAVENGVVTGGVMYECVRHGVQYVLAGSIRDDGPLPDTLMNLVDAQEAYQRAIQGTDMILLLSSMLHSIGVGNMTPAGVRLVCVDISPAVVTKLADRGSVESVGIVTDVGLFLNLLAARLNES